VAAVSAALPTLIRYALSLAVPLHAAELVKVPLADLVKQSPAMGHYLLDHGIRLLFCSSPKETTEALTTVAKAVAILSFRHEGVTFMGDHYKHHHPDSLGIVSAYCGVCGGPPHNLFNCPRLS
jgi:hypothetical protein